MDTAAHIQCHRISGKSVTHLCRHIANGGGGADYFPDTKNREGEKKSGRKNGKGRKKKWKEKKRKK